MSGGANGLLQLRTRSALNRDGKSYMYTYRPAHGSGRPKEKEKKAAGLSASPDCCKLVEQWRENMRAHRNMESTTR
jgi:hypothetical protein